MCAFITVLFSPRGTDPGERLPLPVRRRRGRHVLLHGGPQAPQGLPGGPPVAGGEDEPGGAEPAAGEPLSGPSGAGGGPVCGPPALEFTARVRCWLPPGLLALRGLLLTSGSFSHWKLPPLSSSLLDLNFPSFWVFCVFFHCNLKLFEERR